MPGIYPMTTCGSLKAVKVWITPQPSRLSIPCAFLGIAQGVALLIRSEG